MSNPKRLGSIFKKTSELYDGILHFVVPNNERIDNMEDIAKSGLVVIEVELWSSRSPT
jgi:hypothetical protein